jgi:hypothetical protein
MATLVKPRVGVRMPRASNVLTWIRPAVGCRLMMSILLMIP